MSVPLVDVDRTLQGPSTGPPARPRRRHGRPRRGVAALRRAASPLALLCLWQAASATGVLPADRLAPPMQILRAMGQEWEKGTLQEATGVSLQRVLLGFAVGASSALLLAAVAGMSRIGEDVVDPPMQMLRTVPHLGLLPLLVLWLGIDEAPKITLIALGVAFPLYVNTVAGIRGVDATYLDAARAMRLSWGGAAAPRRRPGRAALGPGGPAAVAWGSPGSR